MTEVVAALRGVKKAYPRVLAAQDITVEFRYGEIHALVGENGAGKSTLVKILGGLLKPNSGKVEVNGQAMRFHNPRAALAAGIGVVHQSGSLIETLTVGENLRLGKIYAPKSISHKLNIEHLSFIREISEDQLVDALGPRERQLVEIQRLLLQRINLLVLDEPTSALSSQESTLLFSQLRLLAKAGCAIVVVSHKLPELIANCDRFTVLQKGRVVAHLHRSVVSAERLVKLMSGPDIPTQVFRQKPATGPLHPIAQEPAIRFQRVCTASSSKYEMTLRHLNLEIRRGEILGLVGRPGSGTTNILKILRGERVAISSGRIEWGQTDRQAVGYIPAQRMTSGTIASFTVGENLALRRRHFLGRLGTPSWRKQRHDFVNSLIRRFDVRPANEDVLVGALSGGNAQKVLVAREMDFSKSLLLAMSPTAGLDVGSAFFVYKALREKASTGSCVVVHSDDLDEIIYLADRLVVIAEGRCILELTGQQITREEIGLALSGVESNSSLREEQRQGRMLPHA
jgi:ABC-type uncharacterized transport system ATPase subunit